MDMDMRMPLKLIRLSTMVRYSASKIKYVNMPRESFISYNGVKEGCGLSATLLFCYTIPLNTQSNDKLNKTSQICAYADYVTVSSCC